MNTPVARLIALGLLVAGLVVLGRAAWIASETFGAIDAVPADAILLDEGVPPPAGLIEPNPDADLSDVAPARWALPLAEPDEGVDSFVDPPAPGVSAPDAAAATGAQPGAPSRIVIPTLRVDSPVVGVSLLTEVRGGRATARWQVARNAAGFHTNSAALGSIGNTVLSGHNNRHGSVFRDLAKVGLGDTILVYVGDRPRAYSVVNKVVARVDGVTDQAMAGALRWLEPTTDDRVTLVSCWPPTGNTHRVFIVAMPTFPDE